MMQQPVADRGFVDIAGFGVVDFESLIWAVLVGMMKEICVKIKNIHHKIAFKLNDIQFFVLAANKLLPRQKQVFD